MNSQKFFITLHDSSRGSTNTPTGLYPLNFQLLKLCIILWELVMSRNLSHAGLSTLLPNFNQPKEGTRKMLFLFEPKKRGEGEGWKKLMVTALFSILENPSIILLLKVLLLDLPRNCIHKYQIYIIYIFSTKSTKCTA